MLGSIYILQQLQQLDHHRPHSTVPSLHIVETLISTDEVFESDVDVRCILKLGPPVTTT